MAETPDIDVLSRRHLRLGWWCLAVFLLMGIALEALHALKIGWYLDVSNSTRRHMFTLAHAHGALIGLIHIAFAATLDRLPPSGEAMLRSLRVAAASLNASSVLLPGGFIAGGIIVHGGDPGLGILLVPPGALLLLVAVVGAARAATAKSH